MRLVIFVEPVDVGAVNALRVVGVGHHDLFYGRHRPTFFHLRALPVGVVVFSGCRHKPRRVVVRVVYVVLWGVFGDARVHQLLVLDGGRQYVVVVAQEVEVVGVVASQVDAVYHFFHQPVCQVEACYL